MKQFQTTITILKHKKLPCGILDYYEIDDSDLNKLDYYKNNSIIKYKNNFYIKTEKDIFLYDKEEVENYPKLWIKENYKKIKILYIN